MTEMREPHGPSMAYTVAVGIGRGMSIDGSSAVSYSTVPAYAGRGAALPTRAMDTERIQMDMANAQKPYEQYLVFVYCLSLIHI